MVGGPRCRPLAAGRRGSLSEVGIVVRALSGFNLFRQGLRRCVRGPSPRWPGGTETAGLADFNAAHAERPGKSLLDEVLEDSRHVIFPRMSSMGPFPAPNHAPAISISSPSLTASINARSHHAVSVSSARPVRVRGLFSVSPPRVFGPPVRAGLWYPSTLVRSRPAFLFLR